MAFFSSASGLTPHGFCLLWQPGLLRLHVASDLLTALAYFSIPIALIALVRRRPDLAYSRMIFLFASFIVACGLTHLMSIVTLWAPDYWLEGAIKAVTAGLSVATASLLWPLIPRLVAMPSAALLQSTINSQRVTQEKLTEANRWLELGEKIGHVGHWHISVADQKITWSDEIYDIFGLHKDGVALTLDRVMQCYGPDDRQLVKADILGALATGDSFEHAADAVRPTGEVRRILSRGQVQLDQAGQPISLFGVSIDKTDERQREIEREEREAALKRALEAAERSEAHYRLLADNVTDLVACVDAQRNWTFVSPSSIHVTGYEPEALMAVPMRDLLVAEDWPCMQAALGTIEGGTAQNAMLFRIRKQGGAQVWIEACGSLMPGGSSIILSMRDVTGRKHAEDNLRAANDRLQEIARIDALTGLANRRCFDQFIDAELRRCSRYGLSLNLILVDIDHFKDYNDSFGHPAGDACLRLIAQTIDSFARRPGDLAARYGGEEFAIILPGISGHAAACLAERIRAAIEGLQIEQGDGLPGCVTVSLGVAGFHPPSRTLSVHDVISAADELLYAAKRAGRNQVASTQPGHWLDEDQRGESVSILTGTDGRR